MAPGHVLGLNATAAATFGDIELPVQLTDAGGQTGLRGYFPGVLLGRANAIASVQFRDDYVSGLDWNLLHFTTVRGFAGTLFADAAAVTACDGYGLSQPERLLRRRLQLPRPARRVRRLSAAALDRRRVPDRLATRRPAPASAGPPAPVTQAFTLLVTFFPSF